MICACTGPSIPSTCCASTRRHDATARSAPFQVHLDHRVPFRFHHVHQNAIAQDARVVDQNVEPAERLDRLIHHPFRPPRNLAQLSVLTHAFAAGRLHGPNHLLRRGLIGPDAVAAGADVVDHDLGAVFGERQRCSWPIPRPAPVTMATRPASKRLMRLVSSSE